MEVKSMEVVLQYDDTQLPAIPGMTPMEMLNHYSNVYPELTTATVDAGEIKEGVLVYEIKKNVGTKG